jgi:hypothetical protein
VEENKMGLSNKKEEQLRQMPIIQNRIKTSKNGKYVIHQTVITNVKPIEYYKAVLANTAKVTEEPLKAEELMIEEGSDVAKQLA